MPPKTSNKVEPGGEVDVEAGGIDNPAIDVTAFSIPPKSDDVTDSFQADGAMFKTALDSESARDVVSDVVRDKPYAGMGKEDLLRFSNTEFWNRFRLISIIVFWGAWLVLLGTVIGLTIVAPRCGDRPTPEWWQKSVIYQIYVRSFYDSIDNDGVGDIKGIIQKLDHIVDLKANAILLSSVYPSKDYEYPDHGYEWTNHMDVHPNYGTLEDMETLIEAAHNKSIAVILDFIPNHTGTDHVWFQNRNGSYLNPYWNYYVWAACSGQGDSPNNWLSVYGESAWTWDADRGACYLHQFLHTQPELNLRSLAVQKELEDILRFWLDKGVNGFRINSAAYLFENTDLTNEDNSNCNGGQESYECLDHTQTKSLSESYDLIQKWRAILDEYTENDTDTDTSNPLRTRILLSDGDVMNSETVKYYGRKGEGSNLPINYMLTHLGSSFNGKTITKIVRDWVNSLPENATTAWLISDQDRSRIQGLFGETYSNAMTLLTMTLPGTALIYYGEEIGMKNYTINNDQDPAGNFSMSRFPFRTPMQWTNGSNAGFTAQGTAPWLEVGADSETVNVDYPDEVSNSTLTLVRDVSRLRAEQDSLQYGALHLLNLADDNIMAFVREHEGFDRLLVVINFGQQTTTDVDITKDKSTISLPSNAGVLLFTNSTLTSLTNNKDRNLKKITLDPGEGFIANWAYSRP